MASSDCIIPPQETMRIFRNEKSFQVVPGANRAFWTSLSKGTWEPETFAVFDRFISPTRSYIDMGSWIGPTVLYAAQIANSSYAIEPDPIAFRDLAQNIANNPELSNNIKAFNVCIAPESGIVEFGSQGQGGDSMSSLLFAKGKTTWKVDGLTFDDFVTRAQVRNCGFIKIDIEGGEYAVLPTMLPYLREQRPTLHLSLHPGMRYPTQGSSIVWKLLRCAISFLTTLKVLYQLRFYRHFYDFRGNRLGFVRMLLVCRPAFAIVVTDAIWK